MSNIHTPALELYWACHNGQEETAQSIMSRTDFVHNYNFGLEGACCGGQVKMANLMISCGADDWDQGLFGACCGGQKEMIEMMIAKGANDWDGGMCGACKGGHKEIIGEMIARGAHSFNTGLYDACLGGHREIVDLMIAHYAFEWNWGLEGACEGGHKELVDLMIAYGANDWNKGLGGACAGNHKEMVEMMIDLNKRDNQLINWDLGLENACRENHREMVDLIIEKVEKDPEKNKYYAVLDWNRGLRHAYKHKELALYLISCGANYINTNVMSLKEKELEFLFLHNVTFNGYEQTSRHYVAKITFTVSNLLYSYLNNDLIFIILNYIF